MHIGDMDVGALPAIAIVGGGIPVATGAALAFKMKKTDQVAACFFGDGASNEGAFHEAVNMGAIWNLPVIYICENNFYGASTHVSKVMKLENVADRAAAYGIPGEIVDGNDVIKVYSAVKVAVDRARRRKGPTLIECKTYRHGGHSRSDACTYRPKGEKGEWLKKDPILRMKEYLIKEGLLSEEAAQKIEKEVENELDEAVKYAQDSPSPEPEDTLQDVLA